MGISKLLSNCVCINKVPLYVIYFPPFSLTELNPYAMFVSTQHGGHLGFFEGGVILPNKATWLERLVLQYSLACREILSN